MSEVHPNAPTPAPTLLLVAYRALGPSEQEEAFLLISQARLERLAGEDSEAGRIIQSLRRVAELVGHSPGIEDYKRIRLQLLGQGEELEPTSRVLRHFGSWHLAKEAVGLADASTPRQIQERFRKRRLGKVWRYTDATLGETLTRATREIGHVPQISEFDHWRQREIELAKARGEEIHLPSATPYRRRWGTWEKALLALGYSEAEINGRLERDA